MSTFIHSMDIVEHSGINSKSIHSSKKDMLTALMFKGALQSPQALKDKNPLVLFHDGCFQIIQKGTREKIACDRVKGLPKDLSADQFQVFLANGGYLWISKDSNDEYCLEGKIRGLGGADFWRNRGGSQRGADRFGNVVRGAIGGCIGYGVGILVTPYVGPVGGSIIAGALASVIGGEARTAAATPNYNANIPVQDINYNVFTSQPFDQNN